MSIIVELIWFDKKMGELVGQKNVSHFFSKKELRILFGEKSNLDGNYLLKTRQQKKFIEQRLCTKFSDNYDYFIRFCGDWTLDLHDAIWIPAPASEFTDKPPMARKDAEKAFASHDTEKIVDALIRVTFYDSDYRWIEGKCLQYLNNENVDLQREAIVCLGHLARIHGKINVDVVVPKLKELKMSPKLSEAVEDTLDDIESYLHVKCQS